MRKAKEKKTTAAEDEHTREIARVFGELARKLFRGENEVEASIVRSKDGGQTLRVEWRADGWEGLLELDRAGKRELTSRELSGVLAFLEAQSDH